MIGVAVFITAWVCAASVDTAWQFGVNTLSEFGISDTAASLYFNYGCMLTGLLIMIFGLGRALNAANWGHIAGGALIVFGGAFLALVGVYTMDEGNVHYFVAISAALFISLGMAAVAIGNWSADKKIFAGVGIVSVCLFIIMVFALDVAEIEAYGIILAMVWFLTESVNMILSGKKS
jgi:hypothetical membrane protein